MNCYSVLTLTKNADGKKYIVLNIPNDKIEAVNKILPGMKAQPSHRSTLKVVFTAIGEEDSFLEIINQLRKALGQKVS